MKATVVITGAILSIVGSAAIAQDMSRDQLNQKPQTMQRDSGASPTARMNDAAQGGVPAGTANSGSLMQKREQGMSPDSTQTPSTDSKSTGTMKQ
jgi:hypothetical protein